MKTSCTQITDADGRNRSSPSAYMQTRLTLAVSRPNETLVPLLKNSAEFLLAIKEEEKNKTRRSTMRPQASFSFFIFSLSSSLLPPRRSFLRVHPSSSSLLPPRPSFLLDPLFRCVRISIRGFVRRLVGWLVGRLVGRSVGR